MDYDGLNPLQPEIAKIIKCSPKSQSLIAKVTKQAKQALNIPLEQRKLSQQQRVKVYNYLVNINSQPDTESPKAPNNMPVNIHSQPDSAIIDPFSIVRVAFYLPQDNSRQRSVVALDGFLINALAAKGINRENIPQWLTDQLEQWGEFSPAIGITRQVRYLITLTTTNNH